MDDTGLGNLTWEAYRHLAPYKVMVINRAGYRNGEQHPDRFTGRVMHVAVAPNMSEVRDFVKDLDIIFSAETPYSSYLLRYAAAQGVSTIIQPNFEFMPWMANENLPRPNVFGAPSNWHYDEIPDPKIHLPVPIASDRFKFHESSSARKFLHIVGRPAANDRNGTKDLVAALPYITSNVEITFYCQPQTQGADDFLGNALRGRKYSRGVRIIAENRNIPNYWDMYTGFDALILPRRYGGLSLPVNEALGAGIPTIMPNISPNNTWLPTEWLVESAVSFKFNPMRGGPQIDVHQTDPKLLAAKIDEFANNPELYQESLKRARELANQYSWDNLKSLYLDTFEVIIKSNGQKHISKSARSR